jgi:hypothetical protein
MSSVNKLNDVFLSFLHGHVSFSMTWLSIFEVQKLLFVLHFTKFHHSLIGFRQNGIDNLLDCKAIDLNLTSVTWLHAPLVDYSIVLQMCLSIIHRKVESFECGSCHSGPFIVGFALVRFALVRYQYQLPSQHWNSQ